MAKLPEEVIAAFENDQSIKMVATVDKEKNVNMVPIGSIRPVGDDMLAYACCFTGKTTNNLLATRKVSVAIFNPPIEGFQIKGTFMKLHNSGELFEEFAGKINPVLEQLGAACKVEAVATIKVTEVYALTLAVAGEKIA